MIFDIIVWSLEISLLFYFFFSFYLITVNRYMYIQGAMLLMMGTADELPKAPVQKTVFMEDMTEQQLASAVCTLYIEDFA